MLDPTVRKHPILSKEEEGHDHWFSMFPYVENISKNASDRSQYPEPDNDATISILHNTAVLRFSSFGCWLFDTSQGALYKQAFPTAIRTSTAQDAIVLNAAAHYDIRAHTF